MAAISERMGESTGQSHPVVPGPSTGHYHLAVISREAAWAAVHEVLPARWCVGRPSYSVERRSWSVTAINERTTGRGKLPQAVTGTGESEIAALCGLDRQFRGIAQPDGSQMDALRRRLRLAYVEGAEEWSQSELGRGMTGEELERVTGRFAAR
jgi:hypothetical protein